MWKCSSLKQCSIFSARNISVAVSSSAVLRPNLAFSPPLSAHLPAPLLSRRTRMPISGSTPICRETAMIWRKFLELLDHQDDLLAQLDAHQRHADETGVLVAVANDQAAELVLQGQAGEQLRLAAHLQAEIVRLARVQDFLHHLAQLVDLDGKDAAILVLIIELGDGAAEGLVDGLDPVAQNVLKTNQHRKFQPARPWPPRSRPSCPPPPRLRAAAWRPPAPPR